MSGLSIEQARRIVDEFLAGYNGNISVRPLVCERQEDIYGQTNTAERIGAIQGAYHPRRHLVTLVTANLGNEEDARRTLRHELLGHYGLNTFRPDEKRALLDRVLETRREPTLNRFWQRVDNLYADKPELYKAEEVFALVAEDDRGFFQSGWDRVRAALQRTLRTAGLSDRPLTIHELRDEARQIAKGIREGRRQQQTFPLSDDAQFRINESDTMDKKPFHELVADKLIEQLKQGTAPWQKPWEAGAPGAFVPHNPTTGKRYRGINAIQLLAENREDPRWMTYRQAQAEGAQVRRGEKGTPVQYWKFSEEREKRDAEGKPVLGADGKPETETVRLERPQVFSATVFNAEQIEGLPPLERKPPGWDPSERAEGILKASGATLRHDQADRAFYRPGTDSIHLPGKEQFASADRYYATALHELGHWTGHPSRLDRDLAHPFGSEGYAREELRAEIASMILGDDLGIGHDPGQHAAYVGSWIKALQEDPMEVFRAASAAEQIQTYVLGFEQQQVQTQAPERQPSPGAEQTTTEDWILRQLEDDLSAAIDRMSAPQLDKAAAVLDAMLPLNTQNDFWQRHELPFDTDALEQRIEAAQERIDTRLDQMEEQAMEEMQPRQDAPVEPARTQAQAPSAEPMAGAKTYINVPYKEKDAAKALGAKWDRQEQAWYVPAGADPAPFARWAKGAEVEPESAARAEAPGRNPPPPREQRHYLAVPYGEREAAKAAGARWDRAAKSWYAGLDADLTKLDRWNPDKLPEQQAPALSPREEFAEALRSLGAVVAGEHPIMDGRKQRIEVEGDRKGEKAGFYVGHLDGHPAGFIQNNRTGAAMNWKSKGYALDPEEKARLHAEAAGKLQARAIEQDRLHAATAERIGRQWAGLVPVTAPTPYLDAKGIKPRPGVFTGRDGRETYVPAYDAAGKLWTMQYIQEDGTKRFAKDSRKEGCFHVASAPDARAGLEALARAPALVIAEGYATAASLSEALGQPVVAAFDAGNLPHVAQALHGKFPDKPVIVAGDDDKHLETNPGRTQAEKAAKAVGGQAVFPIFAPGERAGNPKEFTDFNDLAVKSALGKEAIERQVRPVVERAIERQRNRGMDARKAERAPRQEREPRTMRR